MISGTSRNVFIFKHFVIKVPKVTEQGIFLTGLLGNILERNRYKVSNFDKRLGHVYYCAPFGIFLIMRRYYILQRELTTEEINSLPFINLDNKIGNIGVGFNNKLVVVDYGNSDQHYILGR